MFSNLGKVYWLKVYQIPLAGRNSPGHARWSTCCRWKKANGSTPSCRCEEYTEGHFIFMATANGTVKKTAARNSRRQRSVGLSRLDLEEGDVLIGAAITTAIAMSCCFQHDGKAVRFKETDVRAMGRTARGVRGMRLRRDKHDFR